MREAEPATPILVKPRTAAEMLGVSVWTVDAMIKAGTLKTRLVHRQRRVVVASVNAVAEAEAA